MKRILFLVIFLLLFTACSSPTEYYSNRFSFIEVVENKEDAMIMNIPEIEFILDEYELIVGLDEANEQYSRYNLEQAPAFIVLEFTGVLTKDMVFRTYDEDEARMYIEDLIEEAQEKAEEFEQR
ncbi:MULTISPECIES: hypothetical protein [Bacillus]|uniref:hypothetical protein n=1 Tax=Bacillus TaxID=1386 RepID=UPI000BB8E214|nr:MULTISPECIES: hypothetical protein [Bacillus]